MSDIKTVLIVDDSKVSRMMITSIIKDQFPDWRLLEANHADEAIEINSKNEIDFFSIDLNMPGKDGLELITILKETNKASKYSLLTANIQEHVHNSASALGVACINKPITEKSIGEMLGYFNE